MASRIKNKGKTETRIRARGRPEKKIGSDVVVFALGVSQENGEEVGQGGSPHIFYVMRQEIMERLESSGGRPRLRRTSIRQKIPLGVADWSLLKEIAELLREQNVLATPGQVASELLHRSLKQIDLAAIKASLDAGDS